MPEVERRLAAILAADVAGYSGRAEADEAGALAALRRLRAEAVVPALARHGGRLVKLTGDGFLAEFASVVDAAACAVAIQAAAEAAGDLRLRIGLNLGDVVADGDDLLGDGVNVAARLEGLAEPGGIVVSGTACDHLHGKLASLGFAGLGEQRLKNIARPVRAYRVLRADDPKTAAVAPPRVRPSLAILPFDNLSGDSAQAYFSDGVTEDLITELSRFRDLVVLARHSSFALRGQGLDAVEIGRRLGVRFLVEGSVRRAGGVERAKRKPTDDLEAYDCLLRGQERLAAHGAGADAAARGFFERAVALDPEYALAHAFLALAAFNEPWGDAAAERLAACLDHARRAVQLDPADSRCHRILGLILLTAREFDRAAHHADRGAALNPNDADAAAHRAYVLGFLGRPDEAVAEARRALALNPFDPGWYWALLARALHGAGRHAEAIAAFARIERPGFHHHARHAACHAALGHADEARRCVGRALAEKPDFSSAAWTATLPFRHEADRERLRAELLAAGLPP